MERERATVSILRRLSDQPYVVIDTETSGLDPAVDGVVEVAALRFAHGEVVERYRTLINPGMPIPPTASAIHHITDRDVRNAPPLTDVEAALDAFVGDDLVVAHNAAFDRGFLPVLRDRQWICSMRTARHLWTKAPRHANQVLRSWLGLEPPLLENIEPHRAESDALVTGLIFLRALRTFEATAPQATLADFVAFVRQPVPIERFPYGRKHRDRLISEIDPGYLRWVLDDAAEPAERRRLNVDEDTLAAVRLRVSFLTAFGFAA